MNIFKILFCLLFLSPVLHAQKFFLTAADSLAVERLRYVERDRFFEPKGGYVFDNEDYARVYKLLNKLGKDGMYTWPYRMRVYPGTSTYSYLLEHKYKVLSRDIRPDCFEEAWFTLYDSLMDRAIVQRYGAGFYSDTYTESLLLDKNGKGLSLPYVNHPDLTAAAIKNVLTLIDTSEYKSGEAGCLYILFKHDKVEDAFLGNHFYNFFEVEELRYLKKEIIERLNKLHWNGPKFKGKKIDTAVLFVFADNKLTFP